VQNEQTLARACEVSVSLSDELRELQERYRVLCERGPDPPLPFPPFQTENVEAAAMAVGAAVDAAVDAAACAGATAEAKAQEVVGVLEEAGEEEAGEDAKQAQLIAAHRALLSSLGSRA
jgi:hypothetical protein